MYLQDSASHTKLFRSDAEFCCQWLWSVYHWSVCKTEVSKSWFLQMNILFRLIPAGITLASILNGPCKYISGTACYVGYSLMMHFFAHSLWSLLLSFAYRYYILFHPSPSRTTLAIIICIVYIPSFFQWVRSVETWSCSFKEITFICIEMSHEFWVILKLIDALFWWMIFNKFLVSDHLPDGQRWPS